MANINGNIETINEIINDDDNKANKNANVSF